MRPNQRFLALAAVALLCVAGVIAITKTGGSPENSAATVEADRKLHPATSATPSNSPAARPKPATRAAIGREPPDTPFVAVTQRPTADTQPGPNRTDTAAASLADFAMDAVRKADPFTHADSAPPDEIPMEWGITGTNAESYQLRTSRNVPLSGSACAALSAFPDADTMRFGALVQVASAREFAGKRVEFSGYIATKNAPAGASIWLRADASDRTIVGFENTFTRGIRGTEDWTYQVTVMDIPPEAAVLLYGAVLVGRGTVYVDDLQFRIVDASTPVTAKPIPSRGRSSAGVDLRFSAPPRNLDFEQTQPVDAAVAVR